MGNAEFIDVAPFRTDAGTYALPPDLGIDGRDLRDAAMGLWIWSVGRAPDGARFAATDERFYKRPGFECVWCR